MIQAIALLLLTATVAVVSVDLGCSWEQRPGRHRSSSRPPGGYRPVAPSRHARPGVVARWR